MAVRIALARRALWQRLATEGRDLAELVLVPGLAAALPWRWCLRLFRWLAHWNWLYRQECEEAWRQALQHGCAEPTEARSWLAQRRLVTLLDHADHYLYRTRSPAWMARHMDVEGRWPPCGQAGMLWTFHWGMGLWALVHARAQGLRAPMVLAAPGGPDFRGRTVFKLYVRARMRSVERALGEKIIFAPGAMPGVRQALAHGKQVVVVMDVPQDQVRVTRLTSLLGRPVSVPAVLPALAVAQALPVTVFFLGLDLRSGRRYLHIHPLGVQQDAQSLSDQAFYYLDGLLKASPAAWHLWAQAPRFFVARQGT